MISSLRVLPGVYPVTSGVARIDVEIPAGVDELVVTSEKTEEPMSVVIPEPDFTVIVIDTETTGIAKDTDQIIELCIQYGLEPDAPSTTWLFKPTIPIPASSTAIHGITDDHVKDAPSFKETAPALTDIFAQAQVIIGYNVGFDLEIIAAEYVRYFGRQAAPDWTTKTVIDAYKLWQQMEPRRLTDAYRKFVGGELENAHSATADVRATGDIVMGMLGNFDLFGKDWSEIELLANPDRMRWLGSSRHLQWNGDEVVIGFGKNQGKSVFKVEVGYLRWIIKNEFPEHVKIICQGAIRARQNDKQPNFLAWTREKWPPPPPSVSSIEP